MTDSKTDAIMRLLEEGRDSSEIVSMGYKKGTVYGAQRKWRDRKGTQSSTVDDTAQHTAQSDTVPPEIESDPDILKLKKEIRVAELEKQLNRLRAPLDMETVVLAVREAGRQKRDRCGYLGDDVCDFREWASETEVPAGMGEPISGKGDKWRVNPSPMYCALCTRDIEDALEGLDVDLDDIPLRDIRYRYSCECGTMGTVAVALKCTSCGKGNWWGWWPQATDATRGVGTASP